MDGYDPETPAWKSDDDAVEIKAQTGVRLRILGINIDASNMVSRNFLNSICAPACVLPPMLPMCSGDPNRILNSLIDQCADMRLGLPSSHWSPISHGPARPSFLFLHTALSNALGLFDHLGWCMVVFALVLWPFKYILICTCWHLAHPPGPPTWPTYLAHQDAVGTIKDDYLGQIETAAR